MTTATLPTSTNAATNMGNVSARPMRIAVMGFRGVPNNYSGIEAICENLFAAFAEMGHKVTVYCRPGVIEKKLDVHRGIRLVRTPAPGGKNGETLSHSLLSLTHAITRGDVHENGEKFDLISLHSIAPNLFIKLARLARLPVISHVHGLDHMREKWKGLGAKVIRQAEREMVKHAAQIVTVNSEIVDYYKTKFGVDAALLPNGVHAVSDDFTPDAATLSRFGLTPGGFVVCIGRLVPEKRCHDTIEAFKKVKTDRKLVFVGEGKHTPEYVEQIKKQASDDPRILFTGLQTGEALQTLFRSAALYVTASELEGMPSSLLECMERNVCAITSNIAPHRELMSRVPAYDLGFEVGDIATLTQRIQTALDHGAHRNTIAGMARAFVREHYAWPVLAKRTEELYRQVLERSRGS
ncbi:MAG: glycosyltransferase family 4 protein [Tepidisphaeraceae bacterium]